MSTWGIVAIIAIVVWGVVQMSKARAGIITDVEGNESLAPREDIEALKDAQRERDELRERVQVLERIVTDANTPDARKTQLLAEQIESLRSPNENREQKPKEDMSE